MDLQNRKIVELFFLFSACVHVLLALGCNAVAVAKISELLPSHACYLFLMQDMVGHVYTTMDCNLLLHTLGFEYQATSLSMWFSLFSSVLGCLDQVNVTTMYKEKPCE
jgi:hypothetical protein